LTLKNPKKVNISANFQKHFDDIFETQNYFSTIELVEWFWPQKFRHHDKGDVNEFDKFIAGYVENVASIL
jgi:hypothetical protein